MNFDQEQEIRIREVEEGNERQNNLDSKKHKKVYN